MLHLFDEDSWYGVGYGGREWVDGSSRILNVNT